MSPPACRAATARGFPNAFLARPRPGTNLGTRSRRCGARTDRGGFRWRDRAPPARTIGRHGFPVVAIGRLLPDLPPLVRQWYRRTDGRPRRGRAAPRPPRLARRRRPVAVAVLSVAAGRLRLRRRRLLRRRPGLRRSRGLRPAPGRLPRARAAPARRLRAEPHLRPAPLVPCRPVEPRRSEARLVRLARRRPRHAAQQLGRRLHQRARVDVGRRHVAVVPPPVPARPARPELGQPRGGRGDARRDAVLARPRRRRLPHRRRARHREGPRAARRSARVRGRSRTAASTTAPRRTSSSGACASWSTPTPATG